LGDLLTYSATNWVELLTWWYLIFLCERFFSVQELC